MRSLAGSLRRSGLAWVALAGMVFMSAGPVALGHPAFDTDCAPALTAEHDHAAHRIGQAPQPEPEHCIACHLTRSARGATPSTAGSIAAAGESDAVESGAHAPHRFVARTDAPRGPPSRA